MDRPAALESTATLLARVREGDAGARDRLCGQYLPILMRWAHGRLPPVARDLAETADLVQVTLVKALNAVDRFQPRHEGAFLAYLRTALLNVVRSGSNAACAEAARSRPTRSTWPRATRCWPSRSARSCCATTSGRSPSSARTGARR